MAWSTKLRLLIALGFRCLAPQPLRPVILLTLAAAAGCAAAPSATPTPDDVPVQTDYVYYPITGSTAEELRAQLDRLGPADPDGTHHDAYTQWHVTWRYPHSVSDNRCAIGPVQVSVQVTITLPQ